MIIYFSGTGNSKHVAETCGKELGEEVIALTDHSPIQVKFSGKTLGIVTPVYSWGIPPIVLQYIDNLNKIFVSESRQVPIWVILVCGDDTGKASEMMRNELKRRGLKLAGGWSIQMPNNYVLLPGFDVDPKDLENQKLRAAQEEIKEIVSKIANCKWEEKYVEGSWPRLKTRIVYPLFKHWGMIPSRWNHSDKCISCGICAKICPVKNITMLENKEDKTCYPQWGSNCTSCLACYHVCPTHAVQYGKITKNKGQYFFKQRQ